MSYNNDRVEKVKRKLHGEGIDSKWVNEAMAYMDRNGYSVNQVSTKVAPYIRGRLKADLAIQREKEKEEILKQEQVKIRLVATESKYIEYRNNALNEIIKALLCKETSIEKYSEISIDLMNKKLISINSWRLSSIVIHVLLIGVVVAIIYSLFGSFRDSSENTKGIIVAIISLIIIFPYHLKVVTEKIELSSKKVFKDSEFTRQNLNESIRKFDNLIFKIIEHSLSKDLSKFDFVLKEVLDLDILQESQFLARNEKISSSNPPPLPASTPPPLPNVNKFNH